MTNGDKIKLGFEIALVALLTVMMISVFRHNQTANPDYSKELLKVKDDQINDLKEQNKELLNRVIDHEKVDSSLVVKQDKIKIQYVKIPSSINNLDKEQLRGALSTY